uniref:TFIIS N-terminal domain-containing protein n=1 Tax=Neospora caninum (strain Liverpool) TaxID=572307 RepID=A0A0F7UFZ5_NEOCL|nr:TPA: hypothetical protein BN1204_036815 [Neospora caninum Liverpool]
MTSPVVGTSPSLEGDREAERTSSGAPFAANAGSPQPVESSPTAEAAVQGANTCDGGVNVGPPSSPQNPTNVFAPPVADPKSPVQDADITSRTVPATHPASRLEEPSALHVSLTASAWESVALRAPSDARAVAGPERETFPLPVSSVSASLPPRQTALGPPDCVSAPAETPAQTSFDSERPGSEGKAGIRCYIELKRGAAEPSADSTADCGGARGAEASHLLEPKVEKNDASGSNASDAGFDAHGPHAPLSVHSADGKTTPAGKSEIGQTLATEAGGRPAGAEDPRSAGPGGKDEAAETAEAYRGAEETEDSSDEDALLRPKKKRGEKKTDALGNDGTPPKKRKERPGEEDGAGKSVKGKQKAREGGSFGGGAKKPLLAQKGPKKQRSQSAQTSASEAEDEARVGRPAVSEKKAKAVDRQARGDSAPGEDESDEEANQELEQYIEAITKKLWTLYTQQVVDARELLDHQLSKGGLHPVSNEGVATGLMTACARRRVGMTSLLAGALQSKKLAARRLAASLTEASRSTAGRELSPPRISESELLQLAVEHAAKQPSESAQMPDPSVRTTPYPRPGKPPRATVPSKHDLIHAVSREQAGECCSPCCSGTCLNLIFAPLLASAERAADASETGASETGAPRAEDTRAAADLRAQLKEQDCCCCCVIHAPSRSSSDDEGPSRRSHSTSRWAYADQVSAFDRAKVRPQYTASDDDGVRRGESGTAASRAPDRRGAATRPLAPQLGAGGVGRGRRGLRGGSSRPGVASRAGAPLDRSAMFGTADQRPEKWTPRPAALRRLEGSTSRGLEKAAPLGAGRARGSAPRTRLRGGPAGLAGSGGSRVGKPRIASSSSDSSSDSSSASSSSSEEETSARKALRDGKKRTDSAAEHGNRPRTIGGGAPGALRTGGSGPPDRAALKARFQRFCRQDEEQKLPVLKEACVAMFVTAMKELCGEPWAQHYAVRILLRSRDAVLPQFLRNSGLLLLREWTEALAVTPESVEEHEGMLISVLRLLHRLRPTRQEIAQAKIGLLVRGMAQRRKTLKCDFEACSEEVSAVAEKLLDKWRAMFAPAQHSDGQAQSTAGTPVPSSAAPPGSRASSGSPASLSARAAAPPPPRPGAAPDRQGAAGKGHGTETSQSVINGRSDERALRSRDGKRSAPGGGERRARVEEALRSLEELGWNLEDKEKRRRLEIAGTYSPTADCDEVQEAAGPSARKAGDDRGRRVHFCPARQAVADMVFFNSLDAPNATSLKNEKLKGDEAAEHLACLRQSKAEADSFDRRRRMHTYKEIDGYTAAGSGERNLTVTKPAAGDHTPRRDAPMKFTTPLPLDFSDVKPPHAYPSPPSAPATPPPGSPPVRVEPPKQLFAAIAPFSFLPVPTISSDAQVSPAPALHASDGRRAKGAGIPGEGLSRGTAAEDGDAGTDLSADGESRESQPGAGGPAAGTPLAVPPFGLPPGPPMMAAPPGVPFFPAPCFPPLAAPGFPPFGPPYVALPPPGFMQPPPGMFGLPPRQSEAFPGAPGSGSGRAGGFSAHVPGRVTAPPRGRGGHPPGGWRPERRGSGGERGRGAAGSEEDGAGRGRR